MKKRVTIWVLHASFYLFLISLLGCSDCRRGSLPSVRDDQLAAKKYLLFRGASMSKLYKSLLSARLEKGHSGSWLQANGPNGGIINALAVSTNTSGSNTLFAGTFDGGIYISSNKGTTWIEKNNGLPQGITVFSFLVTPNNTAANKILAGTDAGLYVSSDNGNTWVKSNTGLSDTAIINQLINVPITGGGNYILAATLDGLFKSTNNGQNWTHLTYSALDEGGVAALSYHQDANGKRILIASSFGYGVFKSTDDGVNWTGATNGLKTTSIYTIFPLSKSGGGTKLFAASEKGIFTSSDNGDSWVLVSGISPDDLIVYAFTLTNDKKLFAGTNVGAYVSADEGTTWNPVQTNNLGWDIYSFTSFTEGSSNYVLAGTSGNGIILTNDSGNNWTFINDGLKIANVTAMSTVNTASGTYLIAGLLESRVMLSTNNGNDWVRIFKWPGEGAMVSSFAVDQVGTGPANIFAGSLFNGIELSTDYGDTWSPKTTGISGLIILSMAVSGSGTSSKYIYAGTNMGVYASSDNGENWYSSATGMRDSMMISALAVASNGAGGNNIFAGSFGKGIYISKSNGALWSKISSGEVDTAQVISIAVNPTGNVIFVSTYSSGVFKSTNTGTTWTKVNTSSLSYVNSLLWVKNNLFAGTAGGVFTTSDNGVTWVAVNTGLSNKPVLFLAASSTSLYAGTGGSSVWQRPLNEMTSVDESVGGALPKSYDLKQNYPNPFNPSTSIIYSLPKQSRVSIKVYDALGKEIATLLDAERGAGNYLIEFKSSGLASGIYYYRLKTDDAVITKKMVLMK